MANSKSKNSKNTLNHEIFRLKVKYFDIEAGKQIAILNEQEANEMDIFLSDRIGLKYNNKDITVIVDTSKTMVERGEIGLYHEAAHALGLKGGEVIEIMHRPAPESIEYIKKKMDRRSLSADEIRMIVQETVENKLSEGELASFIAGAYINGFTIEETVALAKAMVETGEHLELGVHPIADKHCVGGVAGNRTTMVIVPILAAAGIYIPKTSSRAITSPAGTADTMEVLAPVVVPIDEMKKIILKTHGCIVWGGAINLAPVDDKLIRIRHTLHLDPRGLLLASILGKKKAVGSEFVVVDIPIGRGAKIEDEADGKSLAKDFIQVGERLAMKIRCLITEGSDPIGKGIGPGLECRDVLQVLKGNGPMELLDKGCLLAGNILEMVGKAPLGKGSDMALNIIKTGKAYDKMMEIIEAQGGNPKIKIDDLPIGKHKYEVKADRTGRVSHVDNRTISKIARAAGAPKDRGAGVILNCEMGDKVSTGDILFEIVSDSESNLSYAAKLVEELKPVELQKIIIGKVE
ncbi:MAG: AMP phosphorylase [Candidatus Micrarchaeia archaeon]